MFTGLVEEIGRLTAVRAIGTARQFTIAAHHVLGDLESDDSICVNGVCLTVIRRSHETFDVQAVDETLRKTNLGQLQPGSRVNLERALRPIDRLGGHFVQGHVDGVARLVGWQAQAAGRLMQVELPQELTRYVVPRGAIALDGVSLTCARVEETLLTIAVIPHTLTHTTLGQRQPGDWLNVETDLLAKHLEKLLPATPEAVPLIDKLRSWGYITPQPNSSGG
ncbi:MAG: riboflavin synthase [candidate division KSB1 bacterium]|nr:riboflavin synthase [candidate division KSB1 bacterium]MDZ7275454.1 riboflavin synthase [candidate division KSB1 bacterium]MDZ7286234.1 riboflavin synthase [candidate division KSB1 bacterium]MDZ7296460.1 riboflavin synthase [candidate division KSB1 bacterium]MDZ7307256.1 riboflavin synthase [candidate division KSB1 bacterium]